MTSASNKPSLEISAALPTRSQKLGRGVVVRKGEIATKERKLQDGGLVREYEPEAPNSRVMIMRYRARIECPIDHYRLLGKIMPEEFEAGMQFRSAWLFFYRGVKTKDSTVPVVVTGGRRRDPVEHKGQAERILREAYAELTVPQATIVASVCGADDPCGSTARLKTLRRALDKLARRWGML